MIDPATGADAGPADPNAAERWLTGLHRSLFLGDAGRLVMAAGAAAMLVLALSGAALVARRAGGWRRWFAPLRGPLAGRLHAMIARIAVFGLVLSAATALWMTASTFGLLPDGGVRPAEPAAVSGLTGFPLDRLAALQDVPADGFRKLGFPHEGDPQDVFVLATDRGTGLIDQGTGAMLSWAPLTPRQRVSETITLLHTGKGAAVLGLILAATYGEGAAPASAGDVLDRLARLSAAPAAPYAVLGFGDRGFPAYCAFAARLEQAALARGWARFLPMDTVDRQSPQDFARWGRALGEAMGLPLDLAHQPAIPATVPLTLIARIEHGAEVQAPMAILRFALPRASLWQRLTGQGFARFQAGDLLGILPEGSAVPRLYSLASGARDGFIEIVVRKQAGGLTSSHLTAPASAPSCAPTRASMPAAAGRP